MSPRIHSKPPAYSAAPSHLLPIILHSISVSTKPPFLFCYIPCDLVFLTAAGGGQDALKILVVHQYQKREHSYVSTKYLQLTCLELCIVCRECSTVTVVIPDLAPPAPRATIPHWLSRALGMNPSTNQTSGSSRIPDLFPRGLLWCNSSMGLLHTVPRFAKVECLTFGDSYREPVHELVWPKELEKLTFGLKFNRRIEGVAWPASLRQLVFGARFNRPLQGVKTWPVSLIR